MLGNILGTPAQWTYAILDTRRWRQPVEISLQCCEETIQQQMSLV